MYPFQFTKCSVLSVRCQHKHIVKQRQFLRFPRPEPGIRKSVLGVSVTTSYHSHARAFKNSHIVVVTYAHTHADYSAFVPLVLLRRPISIKLPNHRRRRLPDPVITRKSLFAQPTFVRSLALSLILEVHTTDPFCFFVTPRRLLNCR